MGVPGATQDFANTERVREEADGREHGEMRVVSALSRRIAEAGLRSNLKV
jgi:hypothetical protein